MTVVHNANNTGSLDHFPVSRDGVVLCSHAHGSTTVVTATGEIDASNIHHLTDYTTHLLGAARPVVIDLAELDFLSAQGISELFDFDERCGAAGVQWALVPSHPVRRLLRICDLDGRLPVAESTDDALERFSSPSRIRPLLQVVSETGQRSRQQARDMHL